MLRCKDLAVGQSALEERATQSVILRPPGSPSTARPRARRDAATAGSKGAAFPRRPASRRKAFRRLRSPSAIASARLRMLRRGPATNRRRVPGNPAWRQSSECPGHFRPYGTHARRSYGHAGSLPPATMRSPGACGPGRLRCWPARSGPNAIVDAPAIGPMILIAISAFDRPIWRSANSSTSA